MIRSVGTGLFFCFTTSALTLFLLAQLTSASPISSANDHPLLRRQTGTYDGSDDDGTGRPGTFHCFKGGQFRSQTELTTLWPQACSTAHNITYDTQHFSYEPNADGSYSEQSVTHEILINCKQNMYGGPPGCELGHTNYLEMTAQFQSARHASEEDCMWAMQRIVAICHGGHQDSRGGWWQFGDDQSTYKIDPQGIVDSKHQKM